MTFKCRSGPAVAFDELCGIIFSDAAKAAEYTGAVYLSCTRLYYVPTIWAHSPLR